MSLHVANEDDERMERIQRIVKQANDPFYPAGQAQAGLQLAQVEVPWLMEQMAILKAKKEMPKVA